MVPVRMLGLSLYLAQEEAYTHGYFATLMMRYLSNLLASLTSPSLLKTSVLTTRRLLFANFVRPSSTSA